MASKSVSNENKKNELMFKVLVIGELATGKTALVKRYVHNYFSPHYRATIGVDFALKIIQMDENTVVRLQLWDVAGQERFGSMMRAYCRDAVGCIVVFDVQRPSTFEAINKWKADLDSKVQLPDGSSVPCLLLANKCDLPKEGLVNNTQQMDNYCREKGFFQWFETSPKENINIEKSIRCLIDEIIKRTDNIQPVERHFIRLENPIPDKKENTKNRSDCCGGK